MRWTKNGLARLTLGLSLGVAIGGSASSVNPVSGRVDCGLLSDDREIRSAHSRRVS
ncbi:MAG: hypothetical protein ACKO15_00845 [Burkholderiales bacterium]